MLTSVREAFSQLAKKTSLTFQVHASRAEHGPPDGGQETILLASYKHGPPDGGQKVRSTEPCRTQASENYKSHF